MFANNLTTMLANNPFAALGSFLPAGAMQVYLVLMVLAVIAGTLYDISHKGSAKFFFASMRKSKSKGRRNVDGAEVLSIAVQTVVVDVLASGEFCNTRRRIAHLLTMYGFLIYLITTVIMVFAYPDAATPTPAILPQLWWLGGLMLCLGGYWFWFFIRVDVSAEGGTPLRLMRADLFVLSLLASVTLGLVWAWLQAGSSSWATVMFGLYIAATTVLFGSVAWSKFAHMFFKPAAAFEKRLSKANGSCANLPTVNRSDRASQERHSMELLRDAPMDMGLGIKREAPRHY